MRSPVRVEGGSTAVRGDSECDVARREGEELRAQGCDVRGNERREMRVGFLTLE